MGVRICRISRKELAALFVDGSKWPDVTVVNGVPADAVCVGISSDLYHDQDMVAIKFEHPSFKEARKGASLPVLSVGFKRPGE